jgi:hypothetical protein
MRITRAGWARARQDFAADPAVPHDPGRRDWIGLRPERAPDLDRLAQARRIREGGTLRQQTAFDDYLARRAADPSFTFRQHLRRTGGAVEE